MSAQYRLEQIYDTTRNDGKAVRNANGLDSNQGEKRSGEIYWPAAVKDKCWITMRKGAKVAEIYPQKGYQSQLRWALAVTPARDSKRRATRADKQVVTSQNLRKNARKSSKNTWNRSITRVMKSSKSNYRNETEREYSNIPLP